MAGVHIVTDSSAALPRGVVQDLAITVIPESVMLDGRAFHAGGNLGEAPYFEALAEATHPARVAPLAAADFLDAYRRILGWGVEVVSLHPPRWLSTSAAVARSARDMLPPDAPVRIVETPWLSAGLGLACIRAAQAGQEATSIDQVLPWLEALDAGVGYVLMAGNRDYLGQSGRLGLAPPIDGAAATATHEVFTLRGDVFTAVGPPTDVASALRLVVQAIAASLPADATPHIGVWSAGADAEAAAVATFLESRHGPAELWIAPADPHLSVIGGPGSFGIAWYAER